ncbi:MAG: hypothetical protein KA105_02645 [Caulobacter sp.]|nr:hypothetical protein [Caulobacter sp.]
MVSWLYGCLSDDTEVLTSDGWRRGIDVAVGDKVAAWEPSTGAIILAPVEEKTCAPWSGPMVRFLNDDTDQLLTPNHRVYHRPRRRQMTSGVRVGWYGDEWECAQADEIGRWNGIKLPCAGLHDGPGIGGDDYAALLGWVWTEGGFDRNGTGVRVYQSASANPGKVHEIDALVGRVVGAHKRYDRERTYTRGEISRPYSETCWFFSGDMADRVRADLPDKRPSWPLLWRMTLAEKLAFWDAAMKGDGSGHDFYQKHESDLVWAQALLALIGQRGKVAMRKAPRDGGGLCITPRDSTELKRRHLVTASQDYQGDVWCVKVATGAFVARRAGRVFITGNSGFPKSHDVSKGIDKAAGPASAASAAWEGWGTALKPACEPWVLARKPLDGTVAANVLAHGTGALNIDGCRVTAGVGDRTSYGIDGDEGPASGVVALGERSRVAYERPALGRWPANVVHDGSDEVVAAFPVTGPSTGRARNNGDFKSVAKGSEAPHVTFGHDDTGGSAARFFYSAKADAEERLGSKHPTVKPVDLMAWLCRLVTPLGGVVLDPFAGSGSTGVACIAEGFDCVLIEREAEYVADIERRIAWARGEGRMTALEMARLDDPANQAKAAGADLPLFGGGEAA